MSAIDDMYYEMFALTLTYYFTHIELMNVYTITFLDTMVGNICL